MAAVLSRINRRLWRLNPILLILVFAALLFIIGKQMFDFRDIQDPMDFDVNKNRDINAYYSVPKLYEKLNSSYVDKLVKYDHSVPLIWIGGVPRSGTTLARVMLDAHPNIRCGEETRVIPRILGSHQQMKKSQIEATRLIEAKITDDVLDNALGAYILSIIANHGPPAPRLCNKDPFTLRSIPRLRKIFPNSKFVLMIRDGRATVHSIISRRVTIKGFDIKTYRGALQDWNKAMAAMYTVCLEAGPTVCMSVYYEKLVLHPEAVMREVLRFLGESWEPIVIHHEQTIGKTGGASLSKNELSTDQVNRPVNLEALTKWVGHIPDDVLKDMATLAPMLAKLGYDPSQHTPNYGTPDEWVKIASDKLKKKKVPTATLR